jgi:hypothetical protein
MDRLAAAIMIALAALVMNGGLASKVLAEEAGMRLPSSATEQKSQISAANGLRSERVLSLLLTLQALQAAPSLLDTPKV